MASNLSIDDQVLIKHKGQKNNQPYRSIWTPISSVFS